MWLDPPTFDQVLGWTCTGSIVIVVGAFAVRIAYEIVSGIAFKEDEK